MELPTARPDLDDLGGMTLQWRRDPVGAEPDDRLDLARFDTHVAVRDAHHPQAPVLVFPLADWQALTDPGRRVVDLRGPG